MAKTVPIRDFIIIKNTVSAPPAFNWLKKHGKTIRIHENKSIDNIYLKKLVDIFATFLL